MAIYVQERPWDPFSPHVPVGEPTAPDPSGGGGAVPPPVQDISPEPAAEPAGPPVVRRRRTKRKPAAVDADAQLARELAALERPE